MLRSSRSAAVVACMLVAASAACGQVTIISQDRSVQATVASTFEDGSTFTDGPYTSTPGATDYGFWPGVVNASGTMVANATQQGGFDGNNTFLLDLWTMNISGGGGPGTAGSSTLTNRFSYTFSVGSPSTYTLNAFFGGSLPIVTTFELTGPGVNVTGDNTTGGVVEFVNATGAMAVGTYTITVLGQGTIGFVGPGGNGGGAGGQQPLMSLVINPAPVTCGTSDFNGDGDFGTDADIEAFFACLAGQCCSTCFSGGADFNMDGDTGTDADIEAFFRVLAGGNC